MRFFNLPVRIFLSLSVLLSVLGTVTALAGEGNTPYAKLVADQFEKIKIVKYAKVQDGPDQPLAQMVLLINLDLFKHLPTIRRKKAVYEWGNEFAEKFPGYALTFAVYSLDKEKIAHVIRKTDEQGNLLDLEFKFFEPGNSTPIFSETADELANEANIIQSGPNNSAPAPVVPPAPPTTKSKDSGMLVPAIVFFILVCIIFIISRFIMPSQKNEPPDIFNQEDIDSQKPAATSSDSSSKKEEKKSV